MSWEAGAAPSFPGLALWRAIVECVLIGGLQNWNGGGRNHLPCLTLCKWLCSDLTTQQTVWCQGASDKWLITQLSRKSAPTQKKCKTIGTSKGVRGQWEESCVLPAGLGPPPPPGRDGVPSSGRILRLPHNQLIFCDPSIDQHRYTKDKPAQQLRRFGQQ